VTDTRTLRELYLNLPVADLAAAKVFFGRLGFDFELRFTNETAAAMVLNDRAWVMLLSRAFFETFTPRGICDTRRAIEALVAFNLPSREAVDELVDKALALGAHEAREPSTHGDFMYARSFFDLDGHQWEVLWMDESKMMEEAS
jgi:predicted lactoylglutathione lyase